MTEYLAENNQPCTDLPKCFAQLDEVFPLGEEGLRVVPEKCIHFCSHHVDCLKRALENKNQRLRIYDEVVDRAYDAGHLNFFERWSTKKYLNRQLNSK